MARIASATGVPCATRTSTWRSFATISSGGCLFLPIVILLRLSRAILQDGPLQRGRINRPDTGRDIPMTRKKDDGQRIACCEEMGLEVGAAQARHSHIEQDATESVA